MLRDNLDCTINLFINAWIQLVGIVAGWVEDIKEKEIYLKKT